MKKTMNTLFMFLFCAAPSVGMTQEQKDTQSNVGVSAKQEEATSQGEKVLESLTAPLQDACSGTDLLDGHGGMDCSAVKVFDFDERATQPALKR